MIKLSEKHLPLAADLMIAAIALFWGTSFALMKEALEVTSPANFMLMRFGASCLMLLPLAYLKRDSFKADYVRPGLIMGFWLFASFGLQIVGLDHTTASRSGFITGMYSVLVPLASILLFRAIPATSALIGAGLAFAGLYLLSSTGYDGVEAFNKGDIITFICAIFCTGQIIANGYYAPGRNAFWLAFIQLSLLTVACFFWALFTGELSFDLPWHVYAIAAFLALTCTVFAFWGQAWAQCHTPPTRAAIIFLFEPVFGAVFAYLWLGEQMGELALVGAGLIIAGFITAQIKPKHGGLKRSSAEAKPVNP